MYKIVATGLIGVHSTMRQMQPTDPQLMSVYLIYLMILFPNLAIISDL